MIWPFLLEYLAYSGIIEYIIYYCSMKDSKYYAFESHLIFVNTVFFLIVMAYDLSILGLVKNLKD